MMVNIKELKNRFNRTKAEVALTGGTIAAGVAPAYCDSDANSAVRTVLNMVFSLALVGGIVMLAMGVVQLVRAVIALTGGDQLQPGQLGKALGMILGGIIAIVLKVVVESLAGTKIDSISII